MELMADEDIRNAAKAKAFFERAQAVAETNNFDYAIDMYLEGLRCDPDSLEQGHLPLHELGLLRQEKGGKKPSMMEKMKRMRGKIPLEQILVVHDELDLPPGIIKLKKGGGHGGHNGLRDLINHLGSKDFHRLRVGIGHPGHRDQVVDYVLRKPSKQDRQQIDEALVYALDRERVCLVEANEFGQLAMDGNEDKLAAKIAVLEGCIAVYSQAVGASAIKQLKAKGIQSVKVPPASRTMGMRAAQSQGFMMPSTARSARPVATMNPP